MNAKWIIGFVLLAFGTTSCLNNDDSNAQWQKEVNAIDSYLETPGVIDENDYLIKDDYTGIRFVIHEFGQNPPPHTQQNVTVNYNATLFETGASFDPLSSYSGLIDDIAVPGFAYAVASVMEDTYATVYIPSKYGYGSGGATGVPANSILRYDFILSTVQKTSAEQTKFNSDVAAIKTYLEDVVESEDTVKHSSGVYYIINEPKPQEDDMPKVYDLVTFDYKTSTLADPPVLKDQGTITGQSIFGFIDGVKVGLPLLRVGEKATFYIPSGLAYGTTGSSNGSIPANTNLIFEVTLKSIDSTQ